MGQVIPMLAGLALLLALPVCTAAEPAAATLAHDRDYSVNAERDMPIVCKPGDIQPFQGRTMSAVFGAAWPQQPDPVDASSHQAASLQSAIRLVPPRGLESQTGVVIVAVLVDQDGHALAEEPVCMTSESYSIAARRTLKGARFNPAVVNGQPVTSVATVALVFKPGRRAGGKRASDASGD